MKKLYTLSYAAFATAGLCAMATAYLITKGIKNR